MTWPTFTTLPPTTIERVPGERIAINPGNVASVAAVSAERSRIQLVGGAEVVVAAPFAEVVEALGEWGERSVSGVGTFRPA